MNFVNISPIGNSVDNIKLMFNFHETTILLSTQLNRLEFVVIIYGYLHNPKGNYPNTIFSIGNQTFPYHVFILFS